MAPTALETRVSNLEGNVDKLENREDKIVDGFSSVQTGLAVLANKLDNLSDRISHVECLSSDVNDLKTTVSEIKGSQKTYSWLMKFVIGATIGIFLSSMATSVVTCGSRATAMTNPRASIVTEVHKEHNLLKGD